MIRATATTLLLFCAVTGAGAQVYPAKTVRVIVGAERGSDADLVARVIAAKLYEVLGKEFSAENMPGAGGNLAAQAAARSDPDGYTLLVVTVDNAINATLQGKQTFNLARDFAPVILATATPNVLVVHPAVPARSVKELLALARARPGQLSFGSVGTGTVQHLSGELFKALSGTQLVHVAHKETLQAETDFFGGKIDLMFPSAVTALPHIQAGRMRALAVTTASRIEALPALPTVAESGLPGYESMTWFGYAVPANVPPSIISRLNIEVRNVLTLPDIRNQFSILGMEILGGSPERFGDYLRDEIAKWARAIKLSGVKAE